MFILQTSVTHLSVKLFSDVESFDLLCNSCLFMLHKDNYIECIDQIVDDDKHSLVT